MESLALLDASALDSLRKYGQTAFVLKMVDLFLDTSEEAVATIETQCQAGQWEQAGFSAHALGSGCGSLGLMRLHQNVHSIDLACRAGRHGDVVGLVGELRPLWEDSCQAMREHRRSFE